MIDFDRVKTGYGGYTPLKHKDGKALSDIEYFELLGRKAIEMDSENSRYPNIPTDYGAFDNECVALAKEIVRGIDDGMSNHDLQQYLNSCIKY